MNDRSAADRDGLVSAVRKMIADWDESSDEPSRLLADRIVTLVLDHAAPIAAAVELIEATPEMLEAGKQYLCDVYADSPTHASGAIDELLSMMISAKSEPR